MNSNHKIRCKRVKADLDLGTPLHNPLLTWLQRRRWEVPGPLLFTISRLSLAAAEEEEEEEEEPAELKRLELKHSDEFVKLRCSLGGLEMGGGGGFTGFLLPPPPPPPPHIVLVLFPWVVSLFDSAEVSASLVNFHFFPLPSPVPLRLFPLLSLFFFPRLLYTPSLLVPSLWRGMVFSAIVDGITQYSQSLSHNLDTHTVYSQLSRVIDCWDCWRDRDGRRWAVHSLSLPLIPFTSTSISIVCSFSLKVVLNVQNE